MAWAICLLRGIKLFVQSVCVDPTQRSPVGDMGKQKSYLPLPCIVFGLKFVRRFCLLKCLSRPRWQWEEDFPCDCVLGLCCQPSAHQLLAVRGTSVVLKKTVLVAWLGLF